MLKKLIDKLFFEKITEEKIECAIDDNTVDYETFDNDQEKVFTGVPAPDQPVLDDWFMSPYGEPLLPKKKFAGNYQGPLYAPYTAVDAGKSKPISSGNDGTHQKMYELSTQNQSTTLQLNPIGGSENVHR